jgi:Holliday junction resolvasome RuvABC DNA-binding subunit
MIKTFEAIFNNATNKGVYGISLVESPAMEGEFIALSKDVKIEYKAVDDAERILVGLVLEPNKPIYRNDNGEEYNIVFSEQTITDLMYNFQKKGYQTNSSVEHSGDRLEGVTFVEQWKVRDENIDTAVAMGLNPKKGSWIAVLKCDSEEVYQDAKNGKFKGFSIDAFMTLKEVNLKTEIEMAEEKKSFKEQVNEALVSLGFKKTENEIKLGEVKTEDDLVIKYDGETPEVGMAVFIDGEEEGVRIPVPVGEIPLEDGNVLVVVEEGVIGEIRTPAAEENVEEEMATPEAASVPKEVGGEIKSLLIKYSEETDLKLSEFETKMEDKFSELIKLNEILKEEVLELSKQPAAPSIKAVASQKSFSEMTNYEKLKFNRNKV